ncbi:MAG: hypothetical protein IJS32_09280, partial [Kiritimatiellae bacterium]|nr:hypothetical protein [Kiritimatiellia bacterium]
IQRGLAVLDLLKKTGIPEEIARKEVPRALRIMAEASASRVETREIAFEERINRVLVPRAAQLLLEKLHARIAGLDPTQRRDTAGKVLRTRNAASPLIAGIPEMMSRPQEDVQAELDSIAQRLDSASGESANAQTQDAELAPEEKADLSLRLSLLDAFGALDHDHGLDRLRNASERLEELIKNGRDGYMQRENARRAAAEADKKQVIDELNAGKPGPGNAALRENNRGGFRRLADLLKGFHLAHASGESMMDWLDRRRNVASESGRAVEMLSAIHDADDANRIMDEEDQVKAAQLWMRALKAKNPVAAAKEIQKLREKPKGGKSGVFARPLAVKEGAGRKAVMEAVKDGRRAKAAELNLSKAEMMDLWTAMRQAEEAAGHKFTDDLEMFKPIEERRGGTGNESPMLALLSRGYTTQTMREIEHALGKDLTDLATGMVNFIETEKWPLVEKVCKSLFYAVPPKNAFYFRLRRTHYSASPASGSPGCASITRSWMRPRSNSMADFEIEDMFSAFTEHLKDINHVATHYEAADHFNRVFRASDTQAAMDWHLGRRGRQAVLRYIDVFNVGASNMGAGVFKKFQRKFARAVIPNPFVGLKQMTSIVASGSMMPPGFSHARYAASVLKNLTLESLGGLRDFDRMLNRESSFWRARYHGAKEFSQAMRYAGSGGIVGAQRPGGFADFMSKFPAFGDKFGALVSTKGVYDAWLRHYQKQGMPPAQAKAAALRKFERAVARAQQSGADVDLSPMQLGQYSSLLTSFKTNPLAYSRIYVNAIRDLALHRGKPKDAAMKLLYVTLAQLMFRAAAAAFGLGWGDDDDKAKKWLNVALESVLTAPLGGYTVLGWLAETGYKKMTKQPVYGNTASSMMPWTDMVDDGLDLLAKTLDGKEWDEEKFWTVGERASSFAGAATGQPIGPVVRSARGIRDVATRPMPNYGAAAFRILGAGRSTTGYDRRPVPPTRPTKAAEAAGSKRGVLYRYGI